MLIEPLHSCKDCYSSKLLINIAGAHVIVTVLLAFASAHSVEHAAADP